MTSRTEQAVSLKSSGQCNCAQAVTCSYADIAGMDEATAYQTAGAFGGGMGCMEGTCGAIVGAGIVLGMHHQDRTAAMRSMKNIVRKFKERNGCTVCKELKGIGTGHPVRDCNDCVADACEFLEEEII